MARDPESELVATLLVHDAVVRVARREGAAELRLASVLADPSLTAGGIVTSVVIDTVGVTSVARTGRTRADRPIVAAVARRVPDGERRLALTGVAATPVLVEHVKGLDPPGDFRGSKEYRCALAATLAARALEAIS